MTLEFGPNQIWSMEELGVLYEQLTHEAFFDIVERFRNLTHFPLYRFDALGYAELTGELVKGKASYDLFIKESLLPKQKALTLAHEVVHIYWEEDVFNYKDTPPGNLGYGDLFPPGADFLTTMHAKFIHEDKVEKEAKRFLRENHRIAIGAYRKMCSDRNMHI